jgi:hypothetical protein
MMARWETRRSTLVLASIFTLGASACTSDQIVGPPARQAAPSAPQNDFFSARNAFARYVAIGTSISAGVQSDGLIATAQAASWPAQLDAMVGRALKQPYIGGTGCHAPVIAPLLLGIRLSGESALTPPSLLSCSPLLPGLAPPFDNVALNGALTSDALSTTPQNISIIDPGNTLGNAQIYARVLQPNETQVSTMLARNPTIVSVELGSNEVLGAITGIAPNVPLLLWAAAYHAVLEDVKSATNTAVVVGLIGDLSHVAAFRTGNELYADKGEFALFHVNVSNDCQGSPNLVFVPLTVPIAVLNGLAAAQHGAGPVPFSCTAGGTATEDFILTPPEASFVNAEMQAMNTQIQAEAAAHHFAYFPLGVLYDRPDVKGTFSVVKLMTSLAPFGPYFSLDGVHPNAAGQRILAREAAKALNATYGLGIPIL